MIISVYLHSYIVDYLKQYGTLEEVINRILDVGETGEFDLTDKPTCEPRTGASRYDINIFNQNYLDLMESYPQNSSKVSLRRLIYWFVSDEMPAQLNWKAINKYTDKNSERRKKLYYEIETKMTKLMNNVQQGTNYSLIDKLDAMIHMFQSLKEDIENG